MTWVAGVTIPNPVAGTVLADTGPLAADYYVIELLLAATTGVEVLWQHRDAGNAVTLHEQTVPVTMSFVQISLASLVQLDLNERLRVVAKADVVAGDVQVSILVFPYSSLAAGGFSIRRKGTMTG